MPFLQPVTLSGRHATLVPLDRTHLAGLQAAARDGELWRLWYTLVPAPEAMAQEIEDYAVWLERIGIPAGQQRRWSRICRRIAAEHLECINLLMLEDIRRAPPPSPSPGDGP